LTEFENVKAYYADVENFDYYTGLYGDSNKDSRIKLDSETDIGLLENAIVLNMQIQSNRQKGVFEESLSAKSVVIPWEERVSVQPVLYRVSKDGFFTTIKNEWIVANGQVYILGSYDGTTENYTAYKIDDEASRYIMRLLDEYEIV